MQETAEPSARARILQVVLDRERVSKAEIGALLGFSRPTIIDAVASLIAEGVICESGEYQSTGGRRAKTLSPVLSYRHFVGLDLTANHASFVVLDWSGQLVAQTRIRLPFEPTDAYCDKIREEVVKYLRGLGLSLRQIPSLGVSLPGILSEDRLTLVRSHALQIADFDLRPFAARFPQQLVLFENDANAAELAERQAAGSNSVYLSLSDTVGGAFSHAGTLYLGNNRRAGEFGHIVLHPGGRRCYCGKSGCADAYLSALRLAERAENLDVFFARLNQGDLKLAPVWDAYLADLAILATNLRMAYDCEVVIGGYVGAFLRPHLAQLRQKASALDCFENGADYITVARRAREASAVGIALRLRDLLAATL